MLKTPSTGKPFDASLINLKDDEEVRYWTAALGVTERRLQKLINEHGASARLVRAFLNITRDLTEAQPG